jgi:uncharacterized protein YukE
MPDFVVDPSQIRVLAAQVQDASTTVGAAGDRLARSTIADPIFDTDEAANTFSRTWSAALKAYAAACEKTSQNLNNTANGYQSTENDEAGLLKGIL